MLRTVRQPRFAVSSITSLLGSAEKHAAGRDVRAAAAVPLYGSLLFCTTAPSVCLMLCDDHALQCLPKSPGIICDCESVDYLSLSTSFNRPHIKEPGSPLLELLCESRDIVVILVYVSISEFAHMRSPTNHLNPLNVLPNSSNEPLKHYPFSVVAQPRSTDRYADNFDTRIGCFARFADRVLPFRRSRHYWAVRTILQRGGMCARLHWL